MEIKSLCQYLDWDSEFFGYNIARITVNRLCQQDMEHVLAWCNSHAIDCLYFLAESDDANTIALVESKGFHLVDIRITFEKQLDGSFLSHKREETSNYTIRLSTPKDIPSLKAIAKENHCNTRFYYDSYFPTLRCEALYETWIEKSCHGYAEAVLVVEFQGQPVGYLCCQLLNQLKGSISLVAIDQGFRGKGLGNALIKASLQWFAKQGSKEVEVVTQGRNIISQRLYQRWGFLTQSVHLWYHKWFTIERGETQ